MCKYNILNLYYISTVHPTFKMHNTNVSTPEHSSQRKNSLRSSSSSATIFLLASTVCKILVAAALKALSLSQRLVFIPTSLLAHIPFYHLTIFLSQRVQCSSPGVRGHWWSLLWDLSALYLCPFVPSLILKEERTNAPSSLIATCQHSL